MASGPGEEIGEIGVGRSLKREAGAELMLISGAAKIYDQHLRDIHRELPAVIRLDKMQRKIDARTYTS